jgi:predicted  nucleic acid-binding Zn-ribbon protein
MLKKIILGTVVVGGIALLVLGPAVFSHVRHAIGAVRQGVSEAFPIEYELQRAEQYVRDIGPEIEKAKRAVAEEQVEIGDLEREVIGLEKRIGEGEHKVKVKNAALKTGDRSFTFAGRVYSRQQVENDLRLTFDDFRNGQTLLDGKKKLLEARTAALAAAIQKLENVRSPESTLVANIEHLRAKLRQAEALEAVSGRVVLDDGALAQAKEILGRCRKRIEVAAKMVENDTGSPAAGATIPVEAVEPRDISAEVDRFFDGPERATQTAAAPAAPAPTPTPGG